MSQSAAVHACQAARSLDLLPRVTLCVSALFYFRIKFELLFVGDSDLRGLALF